MSIIPENNQGTASMAGSAVVAAGAYTGSLYAMVTTNNLAAWTTLIATVGTLAYQFARLFVEDRRRRLANPGDDGDPGPRERRTEAERDRAQAEAEGLRGRLTRAEEEATHLRQWLDRLTTRGEG